jgi:hypothetical protein
MRHALNSLAVPKIAAHILLALLPRYRRWLAVLLGWRGDGKISCLVPVGTRKIYLAARVFKPSDSTS